MVASVGRGILNAVNPFIACTINEFRFTAGNALGEASEKAVMGNEKASQ